MSHSPARTAQAASPAAAPEAAAWPAGMIVSFLVIAGLMVMSGPQGLTWLVTILAVLCAVVLPRSPGFAWHAPSGPRVQMFFLLLTLFLIWLLFRTVTAINFSDALFGTGAFLFSFTSAFVACMLVLNYSPAGRWRWGYFPVANIALALLLAAIIALVMYMLTVRSPTMRHQNPYHYNRGAVYVSLLLPLAWYALGRIGWPAQRILAARLAMVAIVAACASFSESESAKLVLVVMPLVHALMAWRPQFGRAFVMTGIVMATLTGPFVVNATFDFIRATPLLWEFRPGTFAERVLVWQSHHEMIMHAPVTGNGIEYYRTFGSIHPIKKVLFTHIHAHSYLVQVWLDLGFVGAALLAGTLAAAIRLMALLAPAGERMLLTTFVGMLTVWAVSHGMWQSWYIGLCGILFAVCLLALRRAAFEDGAAAADAR